MKIKISRRKSNKVLDILIERIINGERFTIEAMVGELYNPQSLQTLLLAKMKIRGWFNGTLRNKLRDKYQLRFCCLNNKLEWGIPKTEAEAAFSLNSAYKTIKGRNNAISIAMKSFNKQGILPATRIERLEIQTSR